MRRRLTVTGASETIDGVSKLSVSEKETNDARGGKVSNEVGICSCIFFTALLRSLGWMTYCFFL